MKSNKHIKQHSGSRAASNVFFTQLRTQARNHKCARRTYARCFPSSHVVPLKAGSFNKVATGTHDTQLQQLNLRRSPRVQSSSTETQSIPEANANFKFDLPLAVTLAGTAFEAYLVPTGAEGYQEVSVNGTETTYTDRAFLASAFAGILQVTLERATNLPVADITGSSDPYVVISVGDSCGKSSIVNQNLNPTWNETFYLYVKSQQDLLRVRVYDKDIFTSDDELGAAMAGLADLQPGEQRQLALPLKGAGGGGEVTLSVRFLPFTDEDSVMVQAMAADDVAVPEGSPLEGLLPEVTVAAIPEAAEAAQQQLEGVLQAAGGSEAAQQAVDELRASISSRLGAISSAGAASGEALQQLEQLQADLTAFLRDKVQLFAGSQEQQEQQQVRGLSSIIGSPLGPAGLDNVSQLLAKVSALKQQLLPSAPSDQPPTQPPSDLPALTPEQLPKAWKALASVTGLSNDNFTPVAYIDNPISETQAWLYLSAASREVVISFRGTEQVKWQDIATDLNLVPASLNPERADGFSLAAKALKMWGASRGEEMMVHGGFLTAYDAVRPKVIHLLDQLVADTSEGPWRVYVTGHSLGGALATLCAYELSSRPPSKRAHYSVTMYTYGAPRVGNKVFAEAFNRLVPDAWRITNFNDLVPTVPRLMGYCHVRHGVRLTSEGRLVFETEGLADVFGEGRSHSEVLQELLGKVLDESQGWEEVYSSIKASEMSVLSNLSSGAALEEHMEDFYLRTLRRALVACRPELKEQLDSALAQVASVDGGQ